MQVHKKGEERRLAPRRHGVLHAWLVTWRRSIGASVRGVPGCVVTEVLGLLRCWVCVRVAVLDGVGGAGPSYRRYERVAECVLMEWRGFEDAAWWCDTEGAEGRAVCRGLKERLVW